jgi:hypothetical protein
MWAKKFNSQAGRMLSQLGLLPRVPAHDDEFIVMEVRSYKSKTSGPKGILCDRWVAVTEFRGDIRLCAVLSMAKYLTNTADATIEHKLKYDKHTVVERLHDESGNAPVQAAPLFISLKGKLRSGLQPGTFSGIYMRRIITPLKWGKMYSPHVMRAMAASYKHAYGIDVDTCVIVGNWSDKSTFHKHYLRLTHTRVDPARIQDTTLHDWRLLRAHMLITATPAVTQGTSAANTSNDHVIAAALQGRPPPPAIRSSRRVKRQ